MSDERDGLTLWDWLLMAAMLLVVILA